VYQLSRRLQLSRVRQPLSLPRYPHKYRCHRCKLGVRAKYSALERYVGCPLLPPAHFPFSDAHLFDQILQTVNIANLYTDPKTFVDKPTNSDEQSILAAFSPVNSTNATEGAVLDFVDNNFRGEGLELEAQALPNFNANPPFLNNMTDPLLRSFAQIVHTYWTQLIRGTNSSTLCDGKACESTLIPLNHTFVVPGGRFREQCKHISFCRFTWV